MPNRMFCVLAISLVLSVACLSLTPSRPLSSRPAVSPTEKFQPTSTPPIAVENKPLITPNPELISPVNWQDLPVIPSLSPEAIAIYQYGLTLGNNPRAFTKIGDGEISADWFLRIYDQDHEKYNLGIYSNLDKTIEYFSGSFNHHSQAAKRGFNTTRILDPKLADRSVCLRGESPLDCEIRLYRPSFALISMGTNQIWQAEIFSQELRVILDTLIKKGVVPVLSTKADNLEGDNRINIAITELAEEYHLPLWNFWKICQSLPNYGLQADLEHLTYINSYDFTDLRTMTYTWPNRNLSALQVLEMLYLSLSPN